MALCGCQNAPKQGLIVESKEKEATERLNLNTATVAEIEKLPDIGPKLAAKIVEHREKFGPFRKTSDVILVHGMSDGRFRKIRDVVTVR
ncbi:MAG: helix-hairpin-helix domain-containing protein [Acidobacteria bacterium]|nr:helix-hairpin-helix domain-containing protein [Acidobacteriota bacterium]